jgi:hypothetical protein
MARVSFDLYMADRQILRIATRTSYILHVRTTTSCFYVASFPVLVRISLAVVLVRALGG